MNSHLERNKFNYKYYADFELQKSFKDRSTQPDAAWCNFERTKHAKIEASFRNKPTSFKVRYMPNSILALSRTNVRLTPRFVHTIYSLAL